MKKLFIFVLGFIGIMCSTLYWSCEFPIKPEITTDTVLFKYECVESDSPVSKAARSSMEEKLNCKILKDGKLRVTHSNVIFDGGVNVSLDVDINNDTILMNEIAPYGLSGNYSFYTLTSVIGRLKDGEYKLFVRRNGNPRAMFTIDYESSKAKEYDN